MTVDCWLTLSCRQSNRTQKYIHKYIFENKTVSVTWFNAYKHDDSICYIAYEQMLLYGTR